MSKIIFENRKLVRDKIITWILAVNYPFTIYGFVKLTGGDFNFGHTVLVTSPLILLMTGHAIRVVRKNIESISLSNDGAEIEVIVSKIGSKESYTGVKSDFVFMSHHDKWNRNYPIVEIRFRGETIVRQLFIGLRGKIWMGEIFDSLKDAGLHVTRE